MKVEAVSILAVSLALAGFAAEPAFDTLIAHRGESHDAPENTLPAYKTAVERGFGFECDIYRSADGRLFTFHDKDLKRTTGGACSLACVKADWTNQISKANVGGWGKWKGSRFDGTRPALLSEVLALARPGRQIYVEVKGGDSAVGWVPDIKRTVADATNATPESVVFICFSAKACAELKRLMPNFRVYWLTDCRTARKGAKKGEKKWAALPPEQLVAKLRSIGADGVDIRYRPDVITADYVSAVKAAGFSFHVWTVDDPALAKKAFAAGVATVTTNRAKFILDSCKDEKGAK